MIGTVGFLVTIILAVVSQIRANDDGFLRGKRDANFDAGKRGVPTAAMIKHIIANSENLKKNGLKNNVAADKVAYANFYWTGNKNCKIDDKSYVDYSVVLNKCVYSGVDMEYYIFFAEQEKDTYMIKFKLYSDAECNQMLGEYDYFGGPKCDDQLKFKLEGEDKQSGVVNYSVLDSSCPQPRDADAAYYRITSVPFNKCVQIDDNNSAILLDCYEKKGVVYGRYSRYTNRNCAGKPKASNKVSKISTTECFPDGYGGSMWDECYKPAK